MLRLFAIALTASVISIGPAVAGEDVCGEADARYQEVKGELPSDDGVVVVKLYKYNFCPENVTVKPGTTVRFVNVDKRTSHSVWLKEAGEDESGRFFPVEFWEFPFKEKGEYPYLCGPHWEKRGMRGSVTVE